MLSFARMPRLWRERVKSEKAPQSAASWPPCIDWRGTAHRQWQATARPTSCLARNPRSSVHVRPVLAFSLLACLLAPLARAADDAAATPDAAASAAHRPDDAKRTGNVLKLRRAPPAPDHTPTLESFVELVKGRNVDAIYKTFGDEPVRANGEEALKLYLAGEVVPFFADVDRLERTWRVVPATFEDESTGQIAYAYVVTKAGQVKPFTIAWRVEDGRARLMDVKVDRCVKARHPVVPGGCAP